MQKLVCFKANFYFLLSSTYHDLYIFFSYFSLIKNPTLFGERSSNHCVARRQAFCFSALSQKNFCLKRLICHLWWHFNFVTFNNFSLYCSFYWICISFQERKDNHGMHKITSWEDSCRVLGEDWGGHVEFWVLFKIYKHITDFWLYSSEWKNNCSPQESACPNLICMSLESQHPSFKWIHKLI